MFFDQVEPSGSIQEKSSSDSRTGPVVDTSLPPSGGQATAVPAAAGAAGRTDPVLGTGAGLMGFGNAVGAEVLANRKRQLSGLSSAYVDK